MHPTHRSGRPRSDRALRGHNVLQHVAVCDQPGRRSRRCGPAIPSCGDPTGGRPRRNAVSLGYCRPTGPPLRCRRGGYAGCRVPGCERRPCALPRGPERLRRHVPACRRPHSATTPLRGAGREASVRAVDGTREWRRLRTDARARVRRGAARAQLEPARTDARAYSTTYLARVEQVVGWARQQGIYVILDMHQDQYSRYILPGKPGGSAGRVHLLGWRRRRSGVGGVHRRKARVRPLR